MDLSKKKETFLLYSNCIPVKGSKTSYVYDLQRRDRYPIKTSLFDVLVAIQGKCVADIIDEYGEEVLPFMNEFIDKEVAFFTPIPKMFPKLDLSWKNANRLLSSIIEIDDFRAIPVLKIVKQLSALGCLSLQFRFKDTSNATMQNVKQICEATSTSTIQVIEWFIPLKMDSKQLRSDLYRELRTNSVVLYNANENKTIKKLPRQNLNVRLIKKNVSANYQETIHKDYFSINISLFTEAQKHNAGLNRKVCIDSMGNIKNYLSHEKTYGNINEISIEEVIEQKDFQKKWFISNDKIEKCMDCQYRYTCVSNTDLKLKKGKYYKVEDCDFDPYTNTWT